MDRANTFEGYQNLMGPTEHWPTELGPLYPITGLAGEVGEVANEIKKMHRDDGGILTPERKKKIVEELGDVLWYLTSLCNSLDICLEDIAYESLDKVLNKKW